MQRIQCTEDRPLAWPAQVLSWIDICAGLAAKAVARGPCVTASLDSVHFLKPCRLGSVAIIAAMVRTRSVPGRKLPAVHRSCSGS